MNKIKVEFVCVHNSCRSQMAEALGKKMKFLDLKNQIIDHKIKGLS